MQSSNELQIWRQRHEELLREAEVNWLARATRPNREKSRLFPALVWELRRYGGRISKLFRRALRHTI